MKDIEFGNSKTIYIHVGPPKTGTTTLQRFFEELYKANSELILFPETGRFLKGESYFRNDKYRGRVLESGPLGNHRVLVWELKNRVHGENIECLWEKLRKEIIEFSGSTVILSAEAFWFLNELEIARFCDELKDHNLKVILYIREQSRRMISMYTQRIKAGIANGHFMNFTEFIQSENYRNRICDEIYIMRKWSKKLPEGSEALIVRNFDDIIQKTSLEEDFIVNVLCEQSKYDYNKNSARHANAKFEDYIYHVIAYINTVEFFLGSPKFLRYFFYKIRDLIVKSKKREISSLFVDFSLESL